MDSAGRESIAIRSISSIYLSPDSDGPEVTAAQKLREKLEDLYDKRLRIVRRDRWNGEPAILLGPKLAKQSGLITREELESVKQDGFVIRGSGKLVVLSGYTPQGTLYAVYRFLEMAGLKAYPWHYGGGLEVLAPDPDGIIDAVNLTERPFFDVRDFMYRYQPGRFGGTLRDVTIGDLRFARDFEEFRDRGWLSWNHTSAFLVPLETWYDTHPEYYGMDGERRIPRSTRNLKVPLCTCEPGVHRSAAERTLGWIAVQPERRYFAVTNGDTLISCPQCETDDPQPDYITDREVSWVNSVALAVSDRHPDKTLLTYAYKQSVKPPVETVLEPNVLVMYAPWYWDSRTTSAVSFAHPLNVTAMEEFMGWSLKFPGQVGVYDYPGSWVDGTAEKIKFLAKHGVTWYHANGPQGDLLHWVASRLLWDPSLDTDELEREFLEAFYGPAAEVMAQYRALVHNTIDRNSFTTQRVLSDREFVERTRSLLAEAEDIAGRAAVEQQTRILEGVHDGLFAVLRFGTGVRTDTAALRGDYMRFLDVQENIIRNGHEIGLHQSALKGRMTAFRRQLASLGIKVAANSKSKDIMEYSSALLARARLRFDELARKTGSALEVTPYVSRKECASIDFSAPGEAGRWETAGSQPKLVARPVAGDADADRVEGIRIVAPLARLPELKRGSRKVHAGSFFAVRTFDPPLDLSGCPYIDINLDSTRDVPVTVYVDRLHSDVQLHAGRQTVRVDLRSFDNPRKRTGGFSYGNWDGKVHEIGFDIWSQDNFYPYPDVQDTRLTIFDIQAGNHAPEPQIQPGGDAVLWLDQFRANHSFQGPVTGIAASSRQQGQSVSGRAPDHEYRKRYIKPVFRSFTEHRIVSPVSRIMVDAGASAGVRRVAHELQGALEAMYGVTLPVSEGTVTEHTGNAILLGRGAALQSGRVDRTELDYAGEEGFVIRARDGRIVIAGNTDAGTLAGARRYLEDHGAVFVFGEESGRLPDRSGGLLHELYLVDRPWYAGGLPACDSPEEANSLDKARDIARRIKAAVRRGEGRPGLSGAEAPRSRLACQVATRLLWNPFLDTGKLIREYLETPGTLPVFGGRQ